MAVIKTAKIPKKTESAQDTLARFCLYFPQYTFAEARRLPAKRVYQMLRVAQRVEAKRMYELTQIAAAPHTAKGSGVKKMLEYFKNQL